MLPGLRVGHAHCERSRTGVTVLIPDRPVVMACDVRGGGPGTRETDALEPTTLVERVHGLVLSGGSVFGLEAAGEVALLLARSGRGLALSDGLFVPVVPSAILFDLANGGDKGWARKGWAVAGGAEPPYRLLARKAMAALGSGVGEGALGSDDGEGALGSDDGEGALGSDDGEGAHGSDDGE
ncbi:MAG: P1 family peptidase, partial [Sandaracinobacteroides sp.]